MKPAFATWSDFILMGGYAFYVWLAFAVTSLTLLLLVWHSIAQRQSSYRQIRQRQKRIQRRAEASAGQSARQALK